MKPLARSRGGTARRLAAVAGVAALSATLLVGHQPAAHAVPTPDPDRNSTTPTGWGWHPNNSAAAVADFVSAGNRIIDLEVNSSSPTFSAAYVANSGGYARSWWYYYNLTAAQVGDKLTEHNARIVDLEQYTAARGLVRYAVVLVRNTDPAGKAWAWHLNVTPNTISSYVSANNMRIIDLDRLPNGRFNAVYIRNAGVDAKAWWYYYNRTAAQVASLLKRNDARPIDFERTSDGKFDVVMQKRGSEGWWWLHGVTQQQVTDTVNQTGARVYKVSSFTSGRVRLYDVLLIDNSAGETQRIRNAVSNKAIGQWGYYAKRVGGPVLAGLNHETRFEPASMIKILHAVHTLRDVQLNSPTINTAAAWYAHPSYPARYPSDFGYDDKGLSVHDKNVCAYTDAGTHLTSRTYSDPLGTIVQQMMVYSDNRTTDAVVRRYGFDALNQTRTLAGMTDSDLNHRIGCPEAASSQPFENNWLTLTDAGRIYEGVQNGTLLNGTHRTMLYDRMWGWDGASGDLETMIRQEAAALGLTVAEQNQFVDGISRRAKGGGYGFCRNDQCTQQRVITTDGGVVFVPVKTRGGRITSRAYVHGRFVDTHDSYDCTSSTGPNYGKECKAAGSFAKQIDLEVYRTIVRDALATWVD